MEIINCEIHKLCTYSVSMDLQQSWENTVHGHRAALHLSI